MSKLFSLLSTFLLLSIIFFGGLSVPVSANQLTPTNDIICGGPCPLIDGEFEFTRDNVASFILAFARLLTFIGVALAVLFMVFAGIQFIFGKGEEAKTNIITTLIGLVIIIVAYTAVTLLAGLLQGNALGDALQGTGSF